MKEPKAVVQLARKSFSSGCTKPYEFRIKQLKALLKFVNEHEKAIVDILVKENNKPSFEAYAFEINQVTNDIKEAVYNLKEWMEPVKVQKSIAYVMDQAMIRHEPYGVVLVLGAWNYPFMLTLSPVIGAIAAGNCVIIKPSDLTPLIGKFMEEVLPKYVDSSCYQVYNGGIPETTALLEERFDYIFYTGGTQVGKIIYRAASKYLTPVTLELGGKSPVFLDDSADVEVAASRIMWGKCLNTGQSCIGPDYVLCNEYIRDKFVQAAKKVVRKWYGENIKQNPDYGRVINERHYGRIKKLLEGQRIAMGGEFDDSNLYIEPTIVIDVKANDPIMQEEIFGPILPIVTVATPEEAIEFINGREKPLALYVFSTSKMEQEKFLKNTSSGGIVINDVLMHFSCSSLPFGGVGDSGMGFYHGKFSFETFSHKRAALIKKLDRIGEFAQSVRYPPYTENNLRILSLVTKVFPPLPGARYFNRLLFAALAILFGFLGFSYKK
ncbi:aldehyde dehydrogenase, dimeric NADP-preferring-like [Cylas formicarius]|uniref:aldehyde dehydrogenase, dimeric NADP-preferring-like n=1 Tax=Cylas formicarius TaxID=197179 RepID=UPI0029589360|nr:aldehyde dehydrogenase, dimeric NADP-preferring-like [Cylas formicarius]